MTGEENVNNKWVTVAKLASSFFRVFWRSIPYVFIESPIFWDVQCVTFSGPTAKLDREIFVRKVEAIKQELDNQ